MVDKSKLYEDISLELESLRKELSESQVQNSALKQVIRDNGLEDKIEEIDCVSTEEIICVKGIADIATKIDMSTYDDKDIKSFETLYKVLSSIRGKEVDLSKKKLKKADIKKALTLVGNK